jgi:3-oxoacyl-[acyl-carrier-protein] synthase III
LGLPEIAARSDRGISAFALDAATAALADAKLKRDEIDGYVGAPYATNAGSPHAEGATKFR